MPSTLSWSVESVCKHPCKVVVVCWPAVLVLLAAAVGCGRIPPLYDAEARSPAQADANLDGQRIVDVAIATGGAAGDPGTGGRVGGTGGTAATTSTCTGTVLTAATRQPADVLLVLDRSGSMNFSINAECSCDPNSNPRIVCADTTHCETRWSSLAAALDRSMSTTTFLHWGLKLFSSPNKLQCEVVSGVEVPIGADSAAAIQKQIAATTPEGDTPTAFAIAAASNYLQTVADTNSRVILLVTDGKPNCGGAYPSVYDEDVTGTIDAITSAFDAGFLVYVVGIGTGAGADNLDAFAAAGGTGTHFSAQSTDGLTLALDSVSKVATCTFVLDAMMPNPDWVGVYLNKTMVPRDATNGWTFGATTQTILFHGSACDQMLSQASGAVQVLFACNPPLPALLP